MLLERYGNGSLLMHKIGLPTGYFYLFGDDIQEFVDKQAEDEQLVVCQFEGKDRTKFYHVSFRQDVIAKFSFAGAVPCELLCFDKAANAVPCQSAIHLDFTKVLRRESWGNFGSSAVEADRVNLELRLRNEMETTVNMYNSGITRSLLCANDKRTVFLFGLPLWLEAKHCLEMLFLDWNEIAEIVEQKDQIGNKIGSLFVTFYSAITASWVASKLNGVSLYGSTCCAILCTNESVAALCEGTFEGE